MSCWGGGAGGDWVSVGPERGGWTRERSDRSTRAQDKRKKEGEGVGQGKLGGWLPWRKGQWQAQASAGLQWTRHGRVEWRLPIVTKRLFPLRPRIGTLDRWGRSNSGFETAADRHRPSLEIHRLSGAHQSRVRSVPALLLVRAWSVSVLQVQPAIS